MARGSVYDITLDGPVPLHNRYDGVNIKIGEKVLIVTNQSGKFFVCIPGMAGSQDFDVEHLIMKAHYSDLKAGER